MEENLIVTEKELNSFLNNLELKFIAQKLKIENVDKSIITLLKIVKNLQQENKQLKSILTELEEWCNDGIKDELVKFDYGTEIIGEPIKIHIASYEMILDKIQKLKEKYK